MAFNASIYWQCLLQEKSTLISFVKSSQSSWMYKAPDMHMPKWFTLFHCTLTVFYICFFMTCNHLMLSPTSTMQFHTRIHCYISASAIVGIELYTYSSSNLVQSLRWHRVLPSKRDQNFFWDYLHIKTLYVHCQHTICNIACNPS